MCVETVQLLVTAFPEGTTRYKRTHVNHPCAKWTRASLSNYRWLLVHSVALFEEYTRRYGRTHASESVVDDLLDMAPDIPDIGLTPFARAIKEPWKSESMNMSIVDAYRHYYIGDKARFARWAPKAIAPGWWPDKDA